MSDFDFTASLAQKSWIASSKVEFLDGIHPVKRRVPTRIDAENRTLILSGDGIDEVWPFDDLRLIPTESRAGRVTLTLGDHGTPRLVMTDPDMIRDMLDAYPELSATGPARGQVRKAIVFAVAAAASLAGIVAFLMPALANRLAPMISPEAEYALAQTMRGQVIDRMFPTCGTPESDAALQTMTAALMQGIDIPYDLNVSIVQSPELNAFAMPGGQIVFFSGLIDAAEAPDEIAAVLAHEIGHVVYRDPTRTALRQSGTYGLVGLMFGDVTGGSMVPAMINGLLTASYSQDAETRADVFAHNRMENAGQSPEALGRLFQRMEAQMGDVDMGVYAHFSSHPELRARIDAAEQAGRIDPATPIVTDAEWQAIRSACTNVVWNAPDVPFGLDQYFGADATPTIERSEPGQPSEPIQMNQTTAPQSVPIDAGMQMQPLPQSEPEPEARVFNLPQIGGGGGSEPTTIRVERPTPEVVSPQAIDGPGGGDK